ncbi:hypothetical protein [Halobacillus sp. A1]|uniref:hypothetical protein n=1 Tax=Halobacillus sp. A1 TaxID=2880262 RepID=UPI0020A63EE8|nr:hypothetical protein [Halobacillus sp. A1]
MDFTSFYIFFQLTLILDNIKDNKKGVDTIIQMTTTTKVLIGISTLLLIPKILSFFGIDIIPLGYFLLTLAATSFSLAFELKRNNEEHDTLRTWMSIGATVMFLFAGLFDLGMYYNLILFIY